MTKNSSSRVIVSLGDTRKVFSFLSGSGCGMCVTVMGESR